MTSELMITLEEMKALAPDSYILADIRDAGAYSYGCLPAAKHMPHILSQAEDGLIDSEKTYILYCKSGDESPEIASALCEKGFKAKALEGGYTHWLSESFKNFDPDKQKDVEQSIRKKFHKQLFTRFAKGINQYDMIQPGDKIAVCISGGKDSMLMAKLFQELKRHNKFPFELVFLVMDPGYNEINRKVIENNCAMLGIPVTIFDSQIFDAVFEVEKSPCYLCARMRRGYLYSKAKELGCNKIALGHHYDDVIETILMGMMYGAQVQTMMPKLHSTNFEGMELIRPMYLVREDDIKHWRDYNDLHFIQCACRFTDTCTAFHDDGSSSSKRMEIKMLIKKLKEVNPYIEGNIFKSVENVSLSTIIAYKKDGKVHHFLDTYNDIKTKTE